MAVLNVITMLMMLVWWRALVPHPHYQADMVVQKTSAKTDDEQNPRIN